MARGRAVNGTGTVYFDKRTRKYIGEVQIKGVRYKRSGATAKEARDRLDAEVIRKLGDGCEVESSQTFGAWVEHWLDSVYPNDVSAKTVELVRDTLSTHAKPIFPVKLRELTIEDVERMLARCKNKRTGEKLSHSALNRVRVNVSQALQEAMRRGYVNRDVAALARTPKGNALDRAEGEGRQALDAAQLAALFAAAEGDKLAHLLRVSVELAVRPGEAAGLTWPEVDFDRRVAHVGLMRDGQVKTVERSIKLTDAAYTALVAAKAAQERQKARAGSAWVERGFVFTTRTGAPVDAGNVRRTLRRLCVKAGVPVITPYELRHSKLTELSDDASIPLAVLADLAGHVDTRMIMKHYRKTGGRVIDLDTYRRKAG